MAKLQLIEAYRERHGLDWDDHRLAALDLQYHDLRPERSLFARLDTERLVDDEAVPAAVTEPPRRTRAWFRGQCLQAVAGRRWPPPTGIRWCSTSGTDPLRRVPMMDPLKGTAEHVEELLRGERRPGRAAGPVEQLESRGWLTHGRTGAEATDQRPTASDDGRRRGPGAVTAGEKLKAELDDLLDEIDEVLEDNAEEFVRNYVQKGGE